MEMELKICAMDNHDGAWRFAEALLKSDASPDKQPSLRLDFYVTAEYDDKEVFVMVRFAEDCVAAAHVDLDMLFMAAKAMKAFKNAQLSKDE